MRRVTFLATGERHIVYGPEPTDDRVWWTVCRRRFIWGHGTIHGAVQDCPMCQAATP